LLNYTRELPVVTSRASIKLNPPAGCRFTGLISLPDKLPLEARTGENGVLKAEIESLGMFAMLAATYEPVGE
jgi:hypothetical protein